MFAELTYQRAMDSLARSLGLAETEADAAAISNIPSGNQSLANQSSTCVGQGDVPDGSIPVPPPSSTPVVTASAQSSIQPEAQQTQLDPNIAHYSSWNFPQPESSSNETSSPAVQPRAEVAVSQHNGGFMDFCTADAKLCFAQMSDPAQPTATNGQVSDSPAQFPANPLADQELQSAAETTVTKSTQSANPSQATSAAQQAPASSIQTIRTTRIGQGSQPVEFGKLTPSVPTVSLSPAQQHVSPAENGRARTVQTAVVEQYVKQHPRPPIQSENNPAVRRTLFKATQPSKAASAIPAPRSTLQSKQTPLPDLPPIDAEGIDGVSNTSSATAVLTPAAPSPAAATDAIKTAPPLSRASSTGEINKTSSPSTHKARMFAPPSRSGPSFAAPSRGSSATPQPETSTTTQKQSFASATAAAAAAAWNRRSSTPLNTQLFTSTRSENAALAAPKNVLEDDHVDGTYSEVGSSEEGSDEDEGADAAGANGTGLKGDFISEESQDETQAVIYLAVPPTNDSAPGPSSTHSTSSRSRRSVNAPTSTSASSGVQPSKVPGLGTKPWKYHALVEEQLIDGVWTQVGEVEGTHVSPSIKSISNRPRSVSQDIDARSEKGGSRYWGAQLQN